MRGLVTFLGMLMLTFLVAIIYFVIIPTVLISMPTQPPTLIEYYEIIICALGAVVFLILYFGRGSEEAKV